MPNSLDLDQALHYVGPDLGPNCLQKLSADMFKLFLTYYSGDLFSCRLLIFFKHFQKFLSGIPSDCPDQAQHFVGPDPGPNCLQRLSADNTSRY